MTETNNNVKDTLIGIGNSLPYGALSEIAEKCKKTPQYVSRFFSGHYRLTAKNINLLDEAKRIITADKKFKDVSSKLLKEFSIKTK